MITMGISMDFKTKVLRFLASDKYFKIWLGLFYIFAICVVLYILYFGRTPSKDAILYGILAVLTPVFFLCNALQRKIPDEYRTIEEEIIEEGEEFVETPVKEETEKTENLTMIGFYKKYFKYMIVFWILSIALYFSGIIDEETLENFNESENGNTIYIVLLLTGLFYMNYKKMKK